MQLLGLVTNGLTFPGGQPRFDPTHVASQGFLTASGYFGFSAVATGAEFYSVFRPNLVPFLTNNNTPTVTVDGILGLCSKSVNAACRFLSLPAATYTATTMACIVRPTSLAAATSPMSVGATSNGATLFINGGTMIWANFGGGNPGASIALTANVPYFLAGSSNAATCNLVAVNLQNGEILTSTSAGAALTAADGNVRIGNNQGLSNPLVGNTAAAMAHIGFMSMAQLVEWAQSPWDFWYPPYLANLMQLAITGSGPAPATGTVGLIGLAVCESA